MNSEVRKPFGYHRHKNEEPMVNHIPAQRFENLLQSILDKKSPMLGFLTQFDRETIGQLYGYTEETRGREDADRLLQFYIAAKLG